MQIILALKRNLLKCETNIGKFEMENDWFVCMCSMGGTGILVTSLYCYLLHTFAFNVVDQEEIIRAGNV